MYVLLNLLPMWATAVVLVGVTVLVTIVAISLVHRRYAPEVMRRNNEVAGFTFGVIGAIYGLLLALALVAVWGSFDKARADAADEGACVHNLRRIVRGLSPNVRDRMLKDLASYEVATNAEWGKDQPAPASDEALDDLGQVLTEDRAPSSQLFVAEGLARLDRLADLRDARRTDGDGGMPSFLWIVMIIGGVVTVGFSLFFGSENPRSQRAMTATLGATIALVLFAVLEIDHPYEGEISVRSPFDRVSDASAGREGHQAAPARGPVARRRRRARPS